MGDSKRILGLALVPVGGLIAQTARAEPGTIQFDPQANVPSPIAPVFSESNSSEVSTDGHRFTITGGTQVEQNLFHRFDRFNLDAGQIATFLTNPNTRAVFGQVSGGSASYIDGLLQVSGSSADLFVINPSGILFGPNARLELGGSFTATTADWIGFGDAGREQWVNTLTGQNYSGGEVSAFGFSAVAPGSVVNQGNLAVPVGQSLRLLGGNVLNTGSLIASGGEVSAIATPGQSVVRLQDASGLLRVTIAPQDFSAIASSQSTTQNTAPTNTLAPPTSLPALLAGQPQSAEASSFRVNTDGSVALVSGQVDVSQNVGAGGQVNLVAKTVEVLDSVVDASGEQGGTIRVGGAYQGGETLPGSTVTRVDAGSVLRADAIPRGLAKPIAPISQPISQNAIATAHAPEGGHVIVWSDGKTEVAGTISARGGGLVETSGAERLKVADTARVDTAGTGVDSTAQAGTWLLDPLTLTLGNSGGDITPATVVTNLQTTNVTLQADNQITITDAIDASGNTAVVGQGNLRFEVPTLNLNARVTLQPGSTLSGLATTVNVGAGGSVQNGVDAAATGGTVNLAAATYREGREIVIDRQIQLQGQGSGVTTLSGDPLGNGSVGMSETDNHRILSINGDGTTITDLSLRDGIASNDGGGALANYANNVVISATNFTGNRTRGSTSNGGAIHNHGSLSLSGSLLANNQAEGNGGVIDVAEGQVFLSNVVLSNNFANGNGGAVNVDATGRLTVSNITFEQNTAAMNGGAIDNSGVVEVINAGFRDNVAQREGGAIAMGGGGNTMIAETGFLRNIGVERGGAISNRGDATSQLTVQNVDFSENQVTSVAAGVGDGGAVYLNSGGTTTVRNIQFFDNRASHSGGAIAAHGNTVLQLNNATLARNIAPNDGGAIELADSSRLTLSNANFVQNQAARGGGLSLGGQAQATITSATFDANQASLDGGAIQSAGDLAVNGTTFLNNVADRHGAGIDNIGQLRVDGSTFRGGNSIAGSGIFNATVNAQTNVIDSLFEGNTATRDVTTGEGGGIYNIDGSLNVTNSDFQNNQADDAGGAIASRFGNVNIFGTTFSTNGSTFGGALYQNMGALTITGSSFFNNQSTLQGGGLELFDVANGLIQRTLIQGNQAGDGGGGIALSGTTNLTLDQVSLLQNQGLRGGGLDAQLGRNYQGTLNILNSTIAGNRSTSLNGGGMDVNPIVSSPVNISGSTIAQNFSAWDGGGIIFGPSAIFNISNTTLAENQANGVGGGIANFLGTLNLTHTTVANNQSDANNTGAEPGGGLFTLPGSQTRLDNTIVANNQAPSGVDVAGDFVDQGNNLIGIVDGSTGFTNSAWVGTSVAPINPLLAPLANYGGPTQTMALLPGSRAIDGGNSGVLGDQRGIGRVGAPDIGAFESRGFVLVPQGGGGQTTEINTAFGSPLSVAIASPFGEPVDGGQISFVAPTSGSSAIFSSNPLSIPTTAGSAQISLSANGLEGTYDVLATSSGITPVAFTLTNTLPPIPPTPIPPTPIPPTPTPPTPTPPQPPVPIPLIPTPLTPTPLTPTPLIPSDPTSSNPTQIPSFSQAPLYRSGQQLSPPDDSLESEAPLSLVDGNSIAMIDQQFSAEYTGYWGSEDAEGLGLAKTRALLRQAEVSHQARSAVIYAIFVPRGQAEGISEKDFGSVESARLALNRRLHNTAIRDDDQLLLVLVPSAGPPVQQLIDVTRQDVLQQAKLFRMAVSDPEDDISYRPLARQMYQWLFAPVESDVQRLQLDHVMYVVDAGLRTVPLAAMMNDDGFIIERYGLSIIPSVNLLQTSFGDPPPPPQTLAAGADQFMQQENLPAVSLELAAIANSQKSTQVLLNEAFTQANLTAARNQSNAKMLHLATHAEFNAGELPSSYLQFWDSQLTFDQIREMGWEDLELLILSACATAISSPEAELGFAGLAAATGVESSIGSLWNVSDVGTLALMAEFYGQWGQTRLRFDALRRSQLALLQGDTKIVNQSLSTARGAIQLPSEWNLPESADFHHPFYWSGFTLVGNPWW